MIFVSMTFKPQKIHISRLIIYRKFTNSKNIQELKNVLDEIYDRYGNYPVEVTNLFITLS